MPVLVDDNNEWKGWGGLERIDINVDDPVPVDNTLMFDGNSWIQFNVATEVEGQDGHVVQYHIHYSEEDNMHLFHPNGPYEQNDFTWGTHILILQNNENSGESIWNGEEGPGWRLETLIGKRRRITTTKLQRDQARFRNMLLVC